MLNRYDRTKQFFGKKRLKTALSKILLVITAIAMTLLLASNQSAWGQAELLRFNWLVTNNNSTNNSKVDTIDHAAVSLDGYQLFILAAPTTNQRFPLEQRVKGIEDELHYFANSNFDANTLQVTTSIDQQSNQPVISINDRYLMTVTNMDAQLQGRDPQGWATQLTQILRDALLRAKQERQPPFLINRGLIAAGIAIAMFIGMHLISRWKRRLKAQQENIESQIQEDAPPYLDAVPVVDLEKQLHQKQRANLRDLQRRVLQIAYLIILGGGGFIILGLFPYSRWLQAFLLSTPLQVVAIAFGTYLLIRVSNLLIDRFSGFLKARDFAMLKPYQRLDLRVSTVSRVLKNVTDIVLVGLATLAILAAIGFDLVPLLAGAGIVGLAISFAAQGLIKDVINGFLIIFEDQYAVGDVIVLGELGGLVENMNLRITQIRNNEGQLITIPNSSITIVQNLSKDWARVDLSIRVAYDTNPDHALDILRKLAQEIYQEQIWRAKIIEPPEVLGIDDLQHSGMLIRTWIKTQPLQQWAVAREFRRRLKLVMEQEGIAIGIPQQSLLLENTLTLDSEK
ncbi:mechanosensitive ion channel family protein [Pseudanabaena mucicola]|uniref:Mechanosensitive ion channel family protein n=1 Tax=Pseudanabaena mucicola FACHB-723 TaxID=2692860 RepID=A0ABR7ZZ96_9CYAN|nr:mechanosensitive ion channel family protein [Pseudanabaena mucicola]MBD2188904.1 mechanosensitive ion channel family protein [Pseudanabaena mucicola FACHB-723]